MLRVRTPSHEHDIDEEKVAENRRLFRTGAEDLLAKLDDDLDDQVPGALESFKSSLEELAVSFDMVGGKWLLYDTPRGIDARSAGEGGSAKSALAELASARWSKIVVELASPDGVLAQTGCIHTAKVSACSRSGGK